MTSPQQQLGERLRELRRRHFGPRGKAELAERLHIPLAEYERYERGQVPPGEVLVRICEVTGEDLQWLLTGLPGRGTVVITGSRPRHQHLLTQLAQLLDEHPEFAAPLEAFVALLAAGPRVARQPAAALPPGELSALVPLFETEAAPRLLPGGPDDGGPGTGLLQVQGTLTHAAAPISLWLSEPALEGGAENRRTVEAYAFTRADGTSGLGLHSPELVQTTPGLFGVRVSDDTLQPMLAADDFALVAVGMPPRVGRPALLRLADDAAPRCRIWLGGDDAFSVGRLTDGAVEQFAPDALLWSLEVLFRLAPAA